MLTKVDQTLFGPKDGNCFNATIATLLGLPLSRVPNWCADHHNDWWIHYRKWLGGRGYSPIEVHLHPPLDLSEGQYCYLVGPSPRYEDCAHAVVGIYRSGKFEVFHDPHPSRDGLGGEITQVGFLVPLQPSRVVPKIHDLQITDTLNIPTRISGSLTLHKINWSKR